MAKKAKPFVVAVGAVLALVAVPAACGDDDPAWEKQNPSPLMSADAGFATNLSNAEQPTIVHTLSYEAVAEMQADEAAEEPTPTPAPTMAPVVIVTPKPEPVVQKWTQEELDAIALTLSGECYDDKPMDKRRVCEVILNRVSVGGFGEGIIGVLSAENQFAGYWHQSRETAANDYEVAEQALSDWYEIGCKQMSSYLFFVAGDNRENVFSATYE